MPPLRGRILGDSWHRRGPVILPGADQTPWPVSAMAGAGAVAVRRSGQDIHLMADYGGEWIQWVIANITGPYGDFRSLTRANLCLVSQPEGGSGITRSGTWSGGYLTNQTGAYLTFTGSGSVIGFRFGFASNCGIHLVEIDGDSTAANLLPTAQEWVDAGLLTSTALVGNGGTLHPTDRIIDAYKSGAAGNFVIALARGLTNASHTVRVTCTGYKRAAASDTRLSYASAASNLIHWSQPGVDITDPGTEVTLIRWLTDAASSAEYALTAWPTGGSNDGYLGGPAHGAESEVSLTVRVDGAIVTLEDGDFLSGTTVSLEKHNRVHHADLSDPAYLADAFSRFTLTASGLDLTVTIVWAQDGSSSSAYLGMGTWQHSRRDFSSASSIPSHNAKARLRWNTAPSVAIGSNDNSSQDAPSTTAASVIWESDAPGYASSWALGHWVRYPGPINKLWLQDRTGGLDKVYPEVEAFGAFGAGDRWVASFRYTPIPITDPDSHFL